MKENSNSRATEETRKPSKPRRPQPKRKQRKPEKSEPRLDLMRPDVAKTLMVLATLNGGLLIIANILACKIWGFQHGEWKLSLDAGIIIFPFVYIVCDLIAEIYSKKMADWVTYVCCCMNLLAFWSYWAADFLPIYPGQEQIEFTSMLGLSRTVVAGSILGYLCSQLLNNSLFEWIRLHSGEHQYVLRAFGSSVPARIVDSVIFTAIAFGGRFPVDELIRHGAEAFVVASLFEWAICKFISRPLADYISERILYRHGERQLPDIKRGPLRQALRKL